MPELPEVESIRRGLVPWLTGRSISSVEILDRRILGSTSQRSVPEAAAEDFRASVLGLSLGTPARRGKFLWVPFAGRDAALSLHLGMSGQLRIHAPSEPQHKHTRAILGLGSSADRSADLSEPLELRFVDQRIFGHLGTERLDANGIPASAAHIAPDPFEDVYDLEATARRIQRRRTAMKAALLDQTVVSGIGNIYADEALHAAGVHPQAPTDRTRISRIRAVLLGAREVMGRALEQGGTSFDALYVHVNGESGRMTLDVYGWEGRPCRRCGTPIVRERFMNRSSHFCPACQRKR